MKTVGPPANPMVINMSIFDTDRKYKFLMAATRRRLYFPVDDGGSLPSGMYIRTLEYGRALLNHFMFLAT